MLSFWPSDAVLVVVQAGLVAGPRATVPSQLSRLRGSWWATVLPVSLGGTIALLAVATDAAQFYTWLALAAVPILAAAAIHGFLATWLRHGPISWLIAAAAAGGLFLVAWFLPGLVGDAAAVALTAASCLTLAEVLAQAAASWALRVAIVVMATLDAILVFGQLLEGPNTRLNNAAPGAGLPRLQFAEFGSALVGYGDLFIAAVLGAILAREMAQRSRIGLTLVTAGCSAVFDLLFLVVHVLPATVPVAAALLIGELFKRHRREHDIELVHYPSD